MYRELFLIHLIVTGVHMQGRMLFPPGRASLWRRGFGTPVNENDNTQSCGGLKHRWEVNNGRCGVCGDPWDNIPRDHEQGGKFYSDVISAIFEAGKPATFALDISNANGGYFEFRLCAKDNTTGEVSQKCLDEGPLEVLNHGRRFKDVVEGINEVQVLLSEKLICESCLLQWKYTTGDQYGCEFDSHLGQEVCGFGKGKFQTEYFACADIAILPTAKIQELKLELQNTHFDMNSQSPDGNSTLHHINKRIKRTLHLMDGFMPGGSVPIPYIPFSDPNNVQFNALPHGRYPGTSHNLWTWQGDRSMSRTQERIRRRVHLPKRQQVINGNVLFASGFPAKRQGSRVRLSFNTRNNGDIINIPSGTMSVPRAQFVRVQQPRKQSLFNMTPARNQAELARSQTAPAHNQAAPANNKAVHALNQGAFARSQVSPVHNQAVHLLNQASLARSQAAPARSHATPARNQAHIHTTRRPPTVRRVDTTRIQRNFIDPLNPKLGTKVSVHTITQRTLATHKIPPTKQCDHCPFDQCLDDHLRIDDLFPGLFDSPNKFLKCKKYEKLFVIGNYDVLQEGLPDCVHPRFKRQLGHGHGHTTAPVEDDDIGCCATKPQVILPLTVEADNDTFNVVQLGSDKQQFVVQGVCGKGNTTSCNSCQMENNFQWVLVYDPRVRTKPPVSFVPVKFAHYCRCYNWSRSRFTG